MYLSVIMLCEIIPIRNVIERPVIVMHNDVRFSKMANNVKCCRMMLDFVKWQIMLNAVEWC